MLTFLQPIVNPVDAKLLWHKDVPLKVVMFIWRLFCDRLPTKNNLIRHDILNNDSCLCDGRCGYLETLNHLFLHCSTFGVVWYYIYCWLGISSVLPYAAADHFIQFSYVGDGSKVRKSLLHLIWFTTVWEIWKERNNSIFKGKECSVTLVVNKSKLLSYRWLKAKIVVCPVNYHGWWLSPLAMLDMF